MTTINVTAEHIENGVRENCERCPVALAIMDAFPGASGIYVESRVFSISRDGYRRDEIKLPREASEFIWDFDASKTVQPFSFELDYPAEVAA